MLDKQKFKLDNIIGRPYGSHWDIDKKSAQLVPRQQGFSVDGL